MIGPKCQHEGYCQRTIVPSPLWLSEPFHFFRRVNKNVIGFEIGVNIVLGEILFTSSILEAEVGEAPEVSEADTVADHSQNESGSAQPASPLGVFSFI